MSPVTARGVGREEKDEAEMTGTQQHEPMIPPGRVTVKHTFTAGVGTRCLAAGLLVKADHVSSGIPKPRGDRKSTRLNSSHLVISYAVFCLKKKKNNKCDCVDEES